MSETLQINKNEARLLLDWYGCYHSEGFASSIDGDLVIRLTHFMQSGEGEGKDGKDTTED